MQYYNIYSQKYQSVSAMVHYEVGFSGPYFHQICSHNVTQAELQAKELLNQRAAI